MDVPGPSPFRLAARAPAPRTLIDILNHTAHSYPEAPALDDGSTILSYSEMLELISEGALWLTAQGVRPGTRVGIQMSSGNRALYLAILSILTAGAAYVPVDADDPIERAELVFREADVIGIITDAGFKLRASTLNDGAASHQPSHIHSPDLADDAWIIFTSGSTGIPKGVAVTHRNAAAFVDAEAQLFLPQEPLGPGDRVLAGLSVAFDASCEEMWLAWRHGACLVPTPRALVRSGQDLGPWLVQRNITVISTVPTLAALWPAEALEAVRLLIFGGEACPPELVRRLAIDGREVWNTYGPTEATVVSCAALLTGESPVRIGLPLAGWDLAVVDAQGQHVKSGEIGELIIGGVGLARYLDPHKDAEKYAPFDALGWERAYRSGDLVQFANEGLVFIGRADDQVKVGGRRIELGEVDAALQNLPGIAGAAAAVRTTDAGNQLLIGYLVSTDPDFDFSAAHAHLIEILPAPMVPKLAVVTELPTRTSGKVDRDALPWPLPALSEITPTKFTDVQSWVAQKWTAVLGVNINNADSDFFAEGGGSLAAAQLVTVLRERFPTITVADIYDHPRLASLAEFVSECEPPNTVPVREVKPTPHRAGLIQTIVGIPLATLTAAPWVLWLGFINNIIAATAPQIPWTQTINWWVLLLGFILFITPPGRMTLAALGSRALLFRVAPGSYPRGGSVHLRLWIAERLVESSGAANSAGAPWISYFARALGVKIGRGVDLHTLPPVTGLLTLGDYCAIEPEVDLAGWWLDGDVLHIGEIEIGEGAIIGARSTLFPGTKIGKYAEIAAASAVLGKVKAKQHWAGSPAVKTGKTTKFWPIERPRRSAWWVPVFGLSALVVAALPLISIGAGLVLLWSWVSSATTLTAAFTRSLVLSPAAALIALLTFATVTVLLVRLLAIRLPEGFHPVRSRVGWQIWLTERLLDSARTYLFPLYASLLTPLWFRALGATVGKGTEISTALVFPKFTTVADGAFLADDTMIGTYELGSGWLYVAETKIGKRSFVGNSGITAPGRKVPKNSLIAVLSATPDKAKSGSSWLGSPPVRLRRRTADADDALTFAPPLRLKIARASIETLRLFATFTSFALGIILLTILQYSIIHLNYCFTIAVSGLVFLTLGVVAGIITAAVKWLAVGKISEADYPLWSSFVWRNEVADAFVETVAAPWFANAATGTPLLNIWLRMLGAKIGRGVWCETYWLPEADLVSLGDGANVARGCVVQTHLFHDRVMSMAPVTLAPGATLGPHCVALPASGIGAAATVGPGSLVMRGDQVPPSTTWQGNPIVPW